MSRRMARKPPTAEYLAALARARARHQQFIAESGIDYKALAASGFDANSGKPERYKGAAMRIYLDDTRDAPQGWVRAYWPREVIKLLQHNEVAVISLDHDLGDDKRGTGYDVLAWIEEQVFLHGWTPPAQIIVHSANGPAKERMLAAIAAITRLAAANEDAKALD